MYQLNSAKMFYDMADNQAIVINHMTGMYYGFNALGSYVIDQLVAGGDPEEVKKALTACEGCPADLILADPIHDVDEGMGWPVMKS